MKTIAFVLFWFVSIGGLKAQTNTYHAMPDSNAVWQWECNGLGGSCCCNCFGNCLSQYSYQDSIAGDTIIGAFTYKKTHEAAITKYYYSGPVTCAPGGYQSTSQTTTPYYYKGAMRQDTALKKVYFLTAGAAQEVLLYDFDLQIGDTLPVSAIVNSESFYVYEIDSVLISGEYHKRFKLCDITNSFPCNDTEIAYIEGIGNTFGLFAELFIPFEFTCSLSCVRINGLPYYLNQFSFCNPLNLTQGIDDKLEEQALFTTSPNPFNYETNLQTTVSLNKATITVYNCLGEVVSEIKNISGTSYTFYRNNLMSGMYYIRISNDELSFTSKLLISDN